MPRAREDGVQAKRLRAQAEKDKQDALKALDAKERRLQQERLISDEAKKEAKKKLESERDRATNQYYEVTPGNDQVASRPTSNGKGAPTNSVSRESARALAAAPKSKGSAVGKESPPPEDETHYPGFDRGDENEPHDLDERAIPFARREEDDEDRGSSSESDNPRDGGRAAGGRALVVAADVDERFVMPPGRAAETIDEQTAEMKARGEELLKDGKWHTDRAGNPFSSDTFTVICNNVWRTEGCLITAKQLVWTCVVVDKMLQDKKLSIDRDGNARILDTVGVEVGKIIAVAAKKAKKKLGVDIRKIDTRINLATATMAYIKTC
ncbi:hypothetical protein KFL_015660010 [Klebsormidium nitens]|uniref:Uncharacterized protein n=1 Tax=Klebsormidium nitens TaxID=105231 RepID=A0A1Y1IV34_KLENI|nr:hypothetical protein KFL_015660010 [Klebsormidium nitens]|eukprot:GAQ93479.1 hypothetical protein KFL_015660010 [Klebsormidium nitens]